MVFVGVRAPDGLGAEALLTVVLLMVVDVGGDGAKPDAANATEGATVMITGTLQPALSMVRREIPDGCSKRLPVSGSTLISEAPSVEFPSRGVLAPARQYPSA